MAAISPGNGLEASNVELLADLSAALHAMSQPMMVLLCALEYAAGQESVPEIMETIHMGTEACAHLSETIRAMQMQVAHAATGARGS